MTLTVTDENGATDTAQATIMVTEPAPPSPGAEVIVDDLDAGAAAVTGGWGTKLSTEAYGPKDSSGNAIWRKSAIVGSVFRWTPALPAAGEYEVYAWWTSHVNRYEQAPYRIRHNGAIDTVTVNQDVNGGQWNLLGTFTFTGDGSEHVEIGVVESGGARFCADAVKFVRVGD